MHLNPFFLCAFLRASGRVGGLLVTLLAAGCSTPTATPPSSLQASCNATAQTAPPTRALAMAAAARRAHAEWGGQAMDASGRVVTTGASEAEATQAGPGDAAPWQRVMAYWRAIDPESNRLPSTVRFGLLGRADRGTLQRDLLQLAARPLQDAGGETTAGATVSQMRAATATAALAPDALRALQVALDRVAVVDTPWSAAFIGWLARGAGLGADEFAFSEAHADYAAAAWKAGSWEAAGLATRTAMRACDIEQTAPRTGDLMCQARARNANLDRFEQLGAALEERAADGRSLAMHCDVVTMVDADGFETIGGNVLQSVTSRQFAFAPGTRLLDSSYSTRRCNAGSSSTSCVDRHLSHQPWSLLLQWR